MDAATGETYRVPPVPHGGTVEIKHQLPMPPLSDEEKTALEALRGMQREPNGFQVFIVDDTLTFPQDNA